MLIVAFTNCLIKLTLHKEIEISDKTYRQAQKFVQKIIENIENNELFV